MPVLPGIGGIISALLGGASFTGYTSVYNTAVTGVNEPIPSGAAFCRIKIWGATSGGGKSAAGIYGASGSGGGGYAEGYYSVNSSEWGSNLSVTCIAGGAGASANGNGTQVGNCAVSGTLGGSARSLQVTGSGYGKGSGTGGAGGVGSGGNVSNLSGATGDVGDGSSQNGNGGASYAGTAGGLGGIRGAGSGSGYTAGNNGASNGGNGVNGRIEIIWS